MNALVALSLAALLHVVPGATQDETTPAFAQVLGYGDDASVAQWFAMNPTRVFVDATSVARDLLAARDAGDTARAAVLGERTARVARVLGDRAPAPLLARVLAWSEAERRAYRALARELHALTAPGVAPPARAALLDLPRRAGALGADGLLLGPFIALATRLHEIDRVEDALALVRPVRASAATHGDPYALSWAEGWLGQILWQRGALPEAAHHLARAAELEVRLGDVAYRVKLLTDLAMVRLSLGELEEGRRRAEEAVELAAPLEDPGARRAARTVFASTFLDSGEHQRALELCLALAPAPPAPVPRDETQVRIDLLTAAVLSDIGRREAALTFAERAWTVASRPEVRADASLLVLEAELTLGLLLGDVGRSEEGLAHLDTARAAYARAGNPRGVAWAEKNRGWILYGCGHFDQAEAALRRAYQGATALALPRLAALSAVGVAEAALAGDAAVDQGMLDDAEATAAALADVELAWRIAAVRGGMARRVGDDEAALAHFARAVDLVERWRRRLDVPGLLTYALRDRADPYREAAFAAARFGRPRDALRFSELLRARVLFERRRGQVVEAPRDGDEGRADLRRRIAALSFRLREGFAHHTPAARTALRASLAEAEAELDAACLAAEVRSATRVDADRTATAPLVGPASLTAAGLDSALSFLVGEQDTLAFLVTPGGVRLEILSAGRATLGAWIERLRAPLARLGRGELDLVHLDFDHRAARALYDTLLAPFAAELGARVGLVADDCLRGVPFELLVAGGSPGPVDPDRPFAHLAALRFAGLEHAFTYLGSLAPPPRRAAARHAPLVVLAAPDAVGVGAWRDEMRAVAEAGARDVSEVPDATVDDFRRLAPSAGTLHLIAHGFYDVAHPSLGHLLLGDETTEDGARLEAWEIEALELSASLAVLSACHSGEGAWFAGGGLVGLTQSFLAAGVDSVVASTWIVEDAATARFMGRLHRHLARGKDADLALRAARRDVFGGAADGAAPLPHPWFWAGWVLHR